MPSSKSNGSQTSVITTEHTLLDTSDAGVYTLAVDISAMAAGDVTELRIYRKARSGDTYRVVFLLTLSNAADTDNALVLSREIVTAVGAKFTLKQTAGSARAYPWEVDDNTPSASTPPTAAEIATAVWQDTTAGDFTVAHSIGKCLYIDNVVPGGAGGLFIAGSNAATTIAGLTTGALSCSTITASGAVAFQSTLTVTGAVLFSSTFATSGTTTFNALTVTNATTLSGAVSLGSTLTVTGATSLAAVSTSGTVTFNALTVTNATTLTGNVSLGGTLGVTGTTTFAAINTGAIGTGNVTITGTLSTSGTVTFNAFTVTNNFTVSGNWLTTGTTTWTGAAAFSAGLSSNITGNITGNLSGTIGGFTAAALAQFFTLDTTKVYADAVAGSVVKETADNVTVVSGGTTAAQVWAYGTRTLTGSVTVGTNNDKTGYSISGTKTTLDALNDITAASVWAVGSRTLTAFSFTVNTNANATETAIKAKTDNLPSSPAATGDAMTLTSGERDDIADNVLVRDWTATTVAVGQPPRRSLMSGARKLVNHIDTTTTPNALTVMEEDDSTPAYTQSLVVSATAELITSVG